MLQRDQVVAVRLTAAEWSVVLQLLAETPYRVSAPLINSIQPQVMGEQPPPLPPNGGLSPAPQPG